MSDSITVLKHAITRLTTLVTMAGQTLDQAGLQATFELYLVCEREPEIKDALAERAPEFHLAESLRVLDQQGQPAQVGGAVLADLADRTARFPGFQSWVTAAPDTQGLLAARWLCHLTGLRHATVELFIDHPTQPGFTLLQVRGYHKAAAPGSFDLPVAGHVDGLLTIMEGLKKECREELGLDLEADGGVVFPLGSYESRARESGARIKNTEYRSVFRCKPSPAVWLSLRPDPAEVAGLAIFSIDALQDALMRDQATPRQTRRFASGIREALPLYLKVDNR